MFNKATTIHIITGILKQDPRPAYTRSRPGTESSRPEQQFGIRIFDVDLKWSVKGQTLTVTGLEPETTEHKATRS